jgi:hypothetical protein
METLTTKALFPGHSLEELEQAEENLRRYIRIVVRVHEYLYADEERYSKFKALTGQIRSLRMAQDRVNIKNHNRALEA